MSSPVTDMGKAKTAIPVRITAKDVRFSANSSWTSLNIIWSTWPGCFFCFFSIDVRFYFDKSITALNNTMHNS